MKRRFITALFIVAMGLIVHGHPVHVSLCNLEVEKGEMTVTLKLFLDDFQLALQHNYGKIIPYDELGTPENKNILDQYINYSLQIVLNKKDSVRLSYDKTERNEEAIWLYYYVKTGPIKEMQIRNMMLMDIYADQTNLLIIHSGGKQNGYRFTGRHFEKFIDLK